MFMWSIFMFLSIGLASGICPKSRCNSSLLARTCQHPWRILVPARIIVARQVFTNLHDREHTAHVDVVVFALHADYWQTVARNLHTHVTHPRHAALAHGHVTAEKCVYSLVEVTCSYPHQIGCLMPYLIHGVMAHVTVHRPIAWIVRDEFNGSGLTHSDQNRGLRPLC